jgi:glutamate synthase domain-containing protein 3
VTCDDFAQAIADANPDSALAQHLPAFKRWYGQAGTPRVTARGSWDAATQRYTLELEQATRGEPQVIPVRMGLLGADNAPLPLRLEGEANDYLGKGLSGGRIVVVPHREALFDPAQTCLVGNVALYGATGGDVNIRGLAGERFGVRNSGARVVVEGVGHHGCEYMTGGVVVVLGRTGRNFAAGMSGGLAFVYDIDGKFDRRVNRSLVEVGPVDQPADCALLRRMVEDHATRTGSARAQQLLADWDESLARFVKVISTEYRKVLEEREELGSAVRSEDLPVVTAAQG